MGTGVVAFNLAPKRALLCDTNPHLINFYSAIQSEKITPALVKEFLIEEGSQLLSIGEDHYYSVRDRFNKSNDPLDFLFLNRAGFNGMIRFNRKGDFNIPFCRKPNRFAQAYITKIVNQVTCISKLLKTKDFTFKYQSFERTIEQTTDNDIIYCDPPYIDRHVDYYNGWNDTHERELFDSLNRTSGRFILSTWHHNDFRSNDYILSLWNRFNVLTKEHFYHVGGSEENRNPVVEALVTNFKPSSISKHEADKKQLFFPELLTA
jgi:DNA adenine methylase